jgi:hypothetical protein
MVRQRRPSGCLIASLASAAVLVALLCVVAALALSPRGASMLPTPTLEARQPWVMGLDYPTRLYQGEAETIRLILRPPAAGDTTPTVTLTTPGRSVTTPTTVRVRDLFATHTVVGEATLVGDALQIESPTQRAEIEPGQEQRWEWVVRPREAGTAYVTAKLELVFQPKESVPDAKEIRSPPTTTAAQPISVYTIFGLSGRQARLLLTASTVISGGSGGLMAIITLWEKVRGLVRKPAEPDEPSPRPPHARRKTGKSRTRHER